MKRPRGGLNHPITEAHLSCVMRVKRSTLLLLVCVFSEPPRMLCAPTQPLRAGRDFWRVCIEEEQSLPIPSRPGKLALVDPQRKNKEHALWYLVRRENLIRYDYTPARVKQEHVE